MNVTKNDLSFNETKLDFEAMRTTAIIAYTSKLHSICRRLSELQSASNLTTGTYLIAGYLRQDAEDLVIVAETLVTLNEAIKRNIIEIINKPEVV